jgi:hypothetical protein
MECATAKILFEHYAKTALENFEATDKLSGLVRQHGHLRKPRNMPKGRARNAVPPAWHWRSTHSLSKGHLREVPSKFDPLLFRGRAGLRPSLDYRNTALFSVPGAVKLRDVLQSICPDREIPGFDRQALNSGQSNPESVSNFAARN